MVSGAESRDGGYPIFAHIGSFFVDAPGVPDTRMLRQPTDCEWGCLDDANYHSSCNVYCANIVCQIGNYRLWHRIFVVCTESELLPPKTPG